MKKKDVPSPFEYISPITWAERIEMFISCLLFLPVFRIIACILFPALATIWCLMVYYLFRCFGEDPKKHPPIIRKSRICLIKYPMMFLQRIWLFILGFYWINIKGHNVYCGKWYGQTPKVIVANHTCMLDALILVLQHNPTFLAKHAVRSIPFLKTIGIVNELITVDREEIIVDRRRSTPLSNNHLPSFSSSHTDPNGGKMSLTTLDDLQMVNSNDKIYKKQNTTKDRILAHINCPYTQTLAIFPEGTTSRSNTLLQFKAGGAFETVKKNCMNHLHDHANSGGGGNGNGSGGEGDKDHNDQNGNSCDIDFNEDGIGVQPLIITYNKRPNRCCGFIKDTFDYSNTPATNTKVWIFRLLCRWSHSATVTYLAPVIPTPDNGFKTDPIRFASAVRNDMAASMGPTTLVTQHSYEEFFLYKTLCEELKLNGIILRHFDFKIARILLTLPFSTSTSTSPSSYKAHKTEPDKRLSLEHTKQILRSFCKLLKHSTTTSEDEVPSPEIKTKVTESDMINELGEVNGKEVWIKIIDMIEVMDNQNMFSIYHNMLNSDVNDIDSINMTLSTTIDTKNNTLNKTDAAATSVDIVEDIDQSQDIENGKRKRVMSDHLYNKKTDKIELDFMYYLIGLLKSKPIPAFEAEWFCMFQCVDGGSGGGGGDL